MVRDRLTWLTFAQLGVYGYFLYGFGPSVPLLRDEMGVSNAVGGLHGTALAVGVVLAGLVFARVVARFGRAAALRRSLLGLAAGIAVYALAPVLPGTLLGAACCGLFGSIVVTGSIVVLGDRHGPAGPAAISEANAVAAGTGLVAPLLVGAGVSVGLGWRPGLLLAAVAAVSVWFASVRSARRDVAAPVTPALVGESAGDRPGRLPVRYWLAWAVVTFCVGVEFSLTFWAADNLREHTGASAAAATAGVTAVVAGMCAGRIVGGRMALLLDTRPLLLGALVLSGAGFALFWLSTAPFPALAGLAVAGLGVALHYPIGAARAIAASGGRPDRAAGVLSLAAGIASGGAPFALGAAADRVGTHTAFLLVPVLLALAVAGVLAGGTRR